MQQIIVYVFWQRNIKDIGLALPGREGRFHILLIDGDTLSVSSPEACRRARVDEMVQKVETGFPEGSDITLEVRILFVRVNVQIERPVIPGTVEPWRALSPS